MSLPRTQSILTTEFFIFHFVNLQEILMGGKGLNKAAIAEVNRQVLRRGGGRKEEKVGDVNS